MALENIFKYIVFYFFAVFPLLVGKNIQESIEQNLKAIPR
jgi:hypothetical protein